MNAQRAATEWLTWGVQARVVVTDPGALASAANLVRGYLTAADAATNRDRADSEIRRFGSDSDSIETDGATVTPMFAHFLGDALAVARLTDGKLTPTAGSEDPHSWWKIRVEGNRVFSPAGVILDLSATARASSADHCAGTTAELLGCGVLVALGGDIAVAGPPPDNGWQIQVQDLPGDPTCQVAVPSGCGIATASTVKPLARESTATPMWRTVSVIAESCAEAAALSRVAVTMGGSAIDWLHKLDRPARLVDQEFRVTALVGWPDE
ncbi:FAD:protein FMN transferase [Rhodococcus sp. IEGM 1379]|uniref:FAD:protein FMN transferase n=1 Tax=Rhodococcus sp. IEGM 1379 TaxID=3047086 RepID=UPI0024B66EA8|nr:FAD:protein FMN transferase [Rhodococcus sp. IEGM 1379]MDI9918513.1 FAD:protein FMN transferase [Rhodococcus sp. IEGM 1379]